MNKIDQQSPSEFEVARNKLRDCWELASVLNFLKVFEPVIGSNLKISAEEIETALILPNKCLAQLHISLLKGIPPVSKNLKDPDAWFVVLSKKLFMWWPWVAEGDFPFTAAKGAEMATYKTLDPTIRLVILKALCEIRADQHDVMSYINDAKNKNAISAFRKSNIGEDGKGTSYWLDGNETIGFRLYKEVNTFKKSRTVTTINCHWETLATNLEEFQKVVDEYSSSKSKLEVAVSATVETEAIPVLNKLFKKKQRELQKKLNEEKFINNFCRSGITRSCRNRKPITYTFDEYDKTIDEAIRGTKRMKTRDEQRREKKETVGNEGSQKDGEGESTESSSESSKLESEYVSEDYSGEETDENDDENMNHNSSKNGNMKSSDEQRIEEKETVGNEEGGESTESDFDSDSENSKLETKDISETDEDNKENKNNSSKENGNNFIDKTIENKKIIENGDRCIQQIKNFGTKKRLIQRPNRNTALESAIVPDSEDEISSDNTDI